MNLPGAIHRAGLHAQVLAGEKTTISITSPNIETIRLQFVVLYYYYKW